jgi:hypothetical protein
MRPPVQLPSDWFAAFPPMDEGPLTLGIKRRRSPSVPPIVDSHVDNASVRGGYADKRLTCDRCFITFKEIKRLNRHRREVCSLATRLHCDYAGCSVTFKASRRKAVHIKKQHGESTARSLPPPEQSGPGLVEEEMPDFAMTTPPEPGQTHQEYHNPMVDTSHTPRVPQSLMVEENPSTLSASNTRESPLRLYDGLENLPAELEVTNNHRAQVAHMQAIITSIWDRDVDALSKITDKREIDSEFGEAATERLVESLMDDSTKRISPQRQESRKGLASRFFVGSFTEFLRILTPVRLAVMVGFIEGVICLLKHESRPRQDLMDWWRSVPVRNANAQHDVAITAFISYHNYRMYTHPIWISSLDMSLVRDELVSCCPDPNNDMPGDEKRLEHAIRRRDVLGAYALLKRGADRNATLADGTTLVDFALENNHAEIALLLLKPWLVVGRKVKDEAFYPHKILGNTSSDGDSHESEGVLSVLTRLKYAAASMKREVDGTRRRKLQDFIHGIRWIEAKIREDPDSAYNDIDFRLGFKMSHLLTTPLYMRLIDARVSKQFEPGAQRQYIEVQCGAQCVEVSF